MHDGAAQQWKALQTSPSPDDENTQDKVNKNRHSDGATKRWLT